MTNPPPLPPPPEQQPPTTSIKFGDLRRLIGDMVSDVVGHTDPPPQRQSPPARSGGGNLRDQARGRGVEDEVRTAVDKLEKDRKAREEREARDKGYEDKLKELEERTKEKPPVERRRVHRFMGWGE